MALDNKFLEVEDLTFGFTSGGRFIQAVNGVSFSLEKGRALGIVGETGAGKSVVIKAILRILPDHGTKMMSGTIMFEGKDLLSLSEEEMMKIRGNDISMIFQDPMTALNPTMKIGSQITEVIMHHNKISRSEAERRAVAMLEKVGIPGERYGEYPHQFSGGMRQRVVVAMALACNPKLLLADEPTTALDVTIQAQVLNMIAELRTNLGASMILITHDIAVVATACDDIAIMYAGELIEKGTKEQVFDHPSHPYTQGLFHAIPSMNVEEEYLHPIEGLPPDPTDLPDGCKFAPRCPYAGRQCSSGSMPVVKTVDGHFCKCIRYPELCKIGVSK